MKVKTYESIMFEAEQYSLAFIEDAMMVYKKQHKRERIYRRSKSQLKLKPIYLHKFKRIESYLFLFKMALKIVALIVKNSTAEHWAKRQRIR